MAPASHVPPRKAKDGFEAFGVLPQAGRKKTRQVARIATARKLLHAIYWMLVRREEFTITG